MMLPLLAGLAQAGLQLLSGAVLSKGKEIVEQKLGVNLDEALGTEEGRIKLKQLEVEHEEFLVQAQQEKAKLELERDKLEVADRQSAREREARINESVNASWLPKNVASILALVVVIVGLAMLAWTKDPDVRTAVTGLITLVLGYYFGSSRGSQMKDATIASLTKGEG